MKKIIIALLVGWMLVLNGCAPAQTDNDKITVITSLFPQYDFVRQIAQDKVNLTLLLPPGVEPHSFDATPQTIVTIGNADIFIYTNTMMEPWIEKVIDNVKSNKLVIVESSQGIEYIEHGHEEGEEEEDEELDPHVWLDPLNAKIMAQNILDALISVDPDNAGFYQTNANALFLELDDLKAEYDEVFLDPTHKTIIYGGHFAFGYLANRYGLEILSPYTGFSPNAEPTPQAIIELITRMTELNIKTIYYQELIDPKTARVIAEQTGAKMVLLHGAHNVTSEELQAGATYISIMRENALKLKKGFNNE
ncbi:MAG: ABC transporter substrate-binding protein [Firmicutes bacterium HGW-Firmicutes-20]|nr:MAG: ABC transporter substrate-binding protein [Firmicutes bacterium HGW-Firmicutes-20]PKM67816.1 MAG: ABC transporter substrate-binding protein [Firmicutes bacterium HGW-Firmicutes-19]